ncbi:unconventional myosin-IXb isoform X2 [Daktulosphaira vitifoliae]|uniref:unconventional myosin-IXb isoform X2 n=1 Tax=Daktulosphaira vitifoliae TaxID=58002 RepID=UPI0021AA56D3|nr:unconventional myosin-IXb isoform X2 [Daktulosphaira vitifoliae]
MMTSVGHSKVFILDKYFTELQKFWETEIKLQDASCSNEAVHLQQRLRSLSTELVTLRNSLNQGQGATNGGQGCSLQPIKQLPANFTNNNNNGALNTGKSAPTSPSKTLLAPPVLPRTSLPTLPISDKLFKGKDELVCNDQIPKCLSTTSIATQQQQQQQKTETNQQQQQTQRRSNGPAAAATGYTTGTGGLTVDGDLIHLPGPLTEDAVLKALHSRFCTTQMFTNIGPVLLCMNSYKDVGNPMTLTSMRGASLDLKLHKVILDAVRQQTESGYPQAIILSGISGSGKTYASMLLLRQLFDVAGGGPETDAFKHLAAAFTVLRSLGSAKTSSNSESSRIGHFIEVQVTDGALYRTKIHCYFLDQTRVVHPLPNEKNYHIFYQMLAGLTQDERVKLNLEGYSPSNLQYLMHGDTRQDEVEDAARFQSWKSCLGLLGIPFMDVVRVLAAVLLLGNVNFVNNGTGEVIAKGENELAAVARLLGISFPSLLRGITTRTYSETTRGNTQLIKTSCDANMANSIRNSLAKALYCRTVATIVRRANSKRLGSTLGTLSSDSNDSVHNQADAASQHASTIGTAGSKSSKSMAALNNAVNIARHATDGSIGILDMFGFEEPKPSQLEHLCINLCAETMQHFYNTHIFKSSIESCRDEGIHCDIEVDYVDNVPCIDLISSLRTGLLSMLDVECSINGSVELYLRKVKSQHRNNPRLVESKTIDQRYFCIQHFAGRVVYNVTDFLETNKDVVPDDLVSVFHKGLCSFGFATHLFGSELKALYSLETVPRGIKFRISPTSHSDLLNGNEPVSTLTQDFHTRLDNLLRSLVHARPHFVRCIKSNATETPEKFDRAVVMRQIRSLQVLETVNLMAGGFPHRMRYKAFNLRYKTLAPFNKLMRIDDRATDDCNLILQCIEEKINTKYSEVSMNWAFGKRHVFLSEGVRQLLEKLRWETHHNAAVLIQCTWRSWRMRRKWPGTKRVLQMQQSVNPITQCLNGKINMNNRKVNNINSASGTQVANYPISNNTNTATLTRPRPQPITGTPPPDQTEKFDQTILQTCNLVGLNLERPPPLPPSRSYTVSGNTKVGYPQSRIMKKSYPEEGNCDVTLMKGDLVIVVGASSRRGHLIVEYCNRSLDVPFQFLELKPRPVAI